MHSHLPPALSHHGDHAPAIPCRHLTAHTKKINPTLCRTFFLRADASFRSAMASAASSSLLPAPSSSPSDASSPDCSDSLSLSSCCSDSDSALAAGFFLRCAGRRPRAPPELAFLAACQTPGHAEQQQDCYQALLHFYSRTGLQAAKRLRMGLASGQARPPATHQQHASPF